MFKFFGWSTIGSLSTIIIQFGYSVVIARIVSPDDFGIAAIPLLIASIGRTVVDSGVGGALVREHRVTKVHYSTVLRFSIVTGLIITTLLCLFSKQVAEYFEEPRMLVALIITASIITVFSVQVPFNAFLVRSLKFRFRTLVLSLSAFFGAAISIYAATVTDKIIALMIYPLVNVVISTIMLLVYYGGIIKIKMYSSEILKKYLMFGVNTTVSAFLLSLVDWSIQSFSYKYFGAAVLGNYAQAKKTSDLQLNLAKGNISNVLYSIISKDKEEVVSRKNTDFGLGIFLFYTIVISIVLFFSEPLVRIVFGEKWLGMVPFFDILLVSSLILFVDSMIRMVYKIVDRTKLLLLSETIKVVFLFSLLAIGLFLDLDFSTILWLLTTGWIFSFLISVYFVRKWMTGNPYDLMVVLVPITALGLIIYFSLSSYFIILFSVVILIFGSANKFFKVLYNNLFK